MPPISPTSTATTPPTIMITLGLFEADAPAMIAPMPASAISQPNAIALVRLRDAAGKAPP